MSQPSDTGSVTVDQAMQIAIAHHQGGRLAEAESIYRQVIQHMPQHHIALHNLAQIAYLQRHYEPAIGLLKQSIAISPNDANTHNTLAATYFAVGRNDESLTECRAALALDPHLSHAYSNLGNALVGQGDLDDAVTAFRRALELDADNPIAHDGLGGTLLLQGKLQEGYQEREWRWKKPDFERSRLGEIPRWNGEDLHGKRILLQVEQGYGDVFQFSRYAPVLKQRGAIVYLEVVPDIQRLMSTLPGVDRLLIAGFTPPAVDFVSPLMSLPLYVGTAEALVPHDVPYLAAARPLVESLSNRYFRNDPNLKVGIAWAGRPTHANNHNRTMALSNLAPLAEVPGITFYSLQKGDAVRELSQPPAGMKVVDLSPALTDFSMTAAAIAQLDLVITVDTAVCHLAGALAKPVWVMLPYIPDWRWMMNRSDTPWYPTMRLFRQNAVGAWAPVVEAIRQELAEQAKAAERAGGKG